MLFRTISFKEFEQAMDEGGDFILIDLRNAASYEKCHVEGAINIPYAELEDRINECPKEKTLVFYCVRGGQSLLACNHLSQRGYHVINIANGISCYNGKYMFRT